MHKTILVVVLLLVALPAPAQAQSFPPGPFQEEFEEFFDHLESLEGVIPQNDLNQLFNLFSFMTFILDSPDSTPLVRQKLAEAMRCAIFEQIFKHFLFITDEDLETFEWMTMLTQQMEAKAYLLDVIRALFPPLPPAPDPKPILCTVDILVQQGEGFAAPEDGGITITSFEQMVNMKAVARDECGDEIDGTFTWSVEPGLAQFGHEVTPKEGDPQFAQTSVGLEAAIAAIKAQVTGFATEYKVIVEFTDGERTCSSMINVKVRVDLP